MAPKLFVFDAYGTLFDVHGAVNRFKDEIGPQAGALSEMWRTKQLEYTWTYAMMGRWRDFRDLTAAALDTARAATVAIGPELRAKLVEAYEALDCYPDVAGTLKQLRSRGAQTAILSNGSAAMLANAVAAAGLGSLLDAVLSADSVKAFKPLPVVYGLVAQTFGTTPDEVMFVSSNRWDIAGARSFGFGTTWLNRSGKPDEYLDLPPDHRASSFDELLGT